MTPIDPPNEDATLVFETCISRIADEDLKNRLFAISASVAPAATQYQTKATDAALHTIPRNAPIPQVNDKEMAGLYDRMLQGPGRPTYDLLLARAPNGKCPLCAQRKIGSLDHHLPKTYYPIYAVTPINLVPACVDCNKAKSQHYPTSAQTQSLHPYFDNVTGHRWLFATVVAGVPAGFEFHVISPPGWSATLGRRIELHLGLFKLAELYAFHAAEEMVNMRHRLRKLTAAGGQDAVRAHLIEEAESCAAASLNSWQTATYSAMAASDWFCAGGYDVHAPVSPAP